MVMHSAGASTALLAAFLSELRVPASLLCVRVRTLRSFLFPVAPFPDLGGGSALQPCRPSPGEYLPGFWFRRTARSLHGAAWAAEGEGLANLRFKRPYHVPGACNQWAGISSAVRVSWPTAPITLLPFVSAEEMAGRAGRAVRA